MSVAPPSATVQSGGTATFTATATDQNGSTKFPGQIGLKIDQCGGLDPLAGGTGVSPVTTMFTAASVVQDCDGTVTATIPGNTATASVTVVPASSKLVPMTPAGASSSIPGYMAMSIQPDVRPPTYSYTIAANGITFTEVMYKLEVDCPAPTSTITGAMISPSSGNHNQYYVRYSPGVGKDTIQFKCDGKPGGTAHFTVRDIGNGGVVNGEAKDVTVTGPMKP